MMIIYDDFEIDYEHMDDLPLSEHIEWNHLKADKEISTENFEEEAVLTYHGVALDKFRDFILQKSTLYTVNQ